MESQTQYGSGIGLKIRKVRELRNLTQESVAGSLGMTTSGYSRIERGEVKMSLERLEQIAQALGVQARDLVGFDENFFFTNYGHAHDHSFSVHADGQALQQVRDAYAARIADLKDEIQFLRQLLRQKEGRKEE